MNLKSLLLAAAIAGGVAVGASAANAQTIAEYSVTGGYAAFDGTFDFNTTPLSSSTANTVFFSASNGTGAYAGMTEFYTSPIIAGSVYSFVDVTSYFTNNPISYKLDFNSDLSHTTGGLGSIAGVNNPVTISLVSSAPEPGAWALMIAGVAMIGAMLRGSRKRGLFAAA
jgi:hypothetical protein